MGLQDARLELIFERGKLVRWFSHSERMQPHELAVFDEKVAQLSEATSGAARRTSRD
jgi:hypothetical protein